MELKERSLSRTLNALKMLGFHPAPESAGLKDS
jgi:hypothetical protein